MKTVLQTNPLFTPYTISSPGILNFTPVVNAGIPWANNRIMAVIDQTKNTIIYAEGQSNLGGTWGYLGNEYQLKLESTVLGLSSTDTLQVIWDDPRIGLESVLTAPLSSDTPKGWPLCKSYVTTASTNLNIVKSAPGTLGFVNINAVGLASGYLKIYDKATTPTPASDIPKIILPYVVTSGPYGNNGSAQLSITQGIKFYNGISFAFTKNVSNTDNTAVEPNIVVNFVYA